jgi:tetratricopeptide (TPR) repeat protein
VKGRLGLLVRSAAILLAGGVAYANSLAGPFIFDDRLAIVESPNIRRWSPLSTVLFPARESPVAGRPLVNLSFAVDYAIGGLDVRVYHLTNITIHLLCALVLFGIVRRTLESGRIAPAFRPADVACAAALVWTVHPLNSETVDYLTQRTESMMALFYLLTLYAGIRALQSRHVAWWNVAAVSACALGMACKESMVTAPIMMVLYDCVFAFASIRRAFERRWGLYTGLAATWIVLAALEWSGPRVHSAGFASGVGAWTYLLNQMVMIPRYLYLAVWPRSLVLNYGWPRVLTLKEVWPGALAMTASAAGTAIALVRWPKAGFLGAWFFITLAPASSVVPIATEVGAERRMYLPLAGLVVLAVVGAALAWDRVMPADRTRRAPGTYVTAALVLALVGALAVGTIHRNRDYASPLSLARTVLARWPTGLAHRMIGTELLVAGDDRQEAVAQLREAVREGDPMARFSLGLELYNERKLDEAISQLEQFVRDRPMALEVLDARIAIGRAFAMQKMWPEALDEFRRVLTMVPSHVEAHRLVADALFDSRAFGEAAAAYGDYLRYRPADVDALIHRGMSLLSLDRFGEAAGVFREALVIDPRSATIHRSLAYALYQNDDVEAAAGHARELVALAPRDASAHDLLGIILGSQNKLEESAEQFSLALAIDPADPDARLYLARIRSIPPGARR